MRADLPPSRAATRDRLIATVTAAMDQWVPERDVFEGLTKEGGDLQRLLQDLQQAGAENDAPDAAREGDVDDEIAGEDERERLAAVLRDDSDPAEDARKKRNLVRVGEETDAAWRPRFVAALHARLQPAHERALQQCDDLWQLSPERRIFLAQVWLGRRLAAAEDRLCVLMQELSDTAAERAKLEQARDIELLRSKRVVGMTITGASIHAGLLRGLKPTTVLVEEAAEVIETQLLAVLGPWVEHLIMIGDHEQLPPPVASYRLRQSHHFAVSMLERVINNRLHYATLMRQSRQRPELSRLLCDRYPDMQDNLKIVGKLTPLESMHQSLFWWTHEHPEQKGRSPSNHEEAAMVQALVMYLVAQGTRPRDITVLTPYVGQMRLLRRTVRDRVQQYWETAKGEKHNGQLAVESVDRFQGDQNEVIIVSLVRSNPRRLSGFLEGDGGINRRVVLQSRARRALFLIGNLETLRYNTVKGDRVESTVWGPLVEAMGERIHHSIPLQCPRHPLNDQGEPLILEARSAADIPRAGQSVCKRPCGMLKDCLKHHCKRECHGETLEWHDAEKCTEKVKFRCVMGHQCERSCNEPESAVRCTEIVKFTCPKGHSQIRACWLPEEDVPCLLEVQCKCARGHHLLKKECVATVPECTEPCKVVLNCGHLCDKRCGERCPATVDECAACGREYEARMQRQREVAQQQREEEARRLAERLERLRAEGEPVKELEECGEDQLKQLQRTVVPLAQAAGTFLRLEGAESVRDSAAEIRFVKAQQSLGTLGVTVEWLVQLESDAAVVAAADEGFKTSKRDGWGHCLALRAGATRDGKALLCRVACGSCRTVSCSELDELGPDPGRMRKEWKCDSVKLVGDSGGDLLIVFKPRLVLVTHVLRVARAPAPDLPPYWSPEPLPQDKPWRLLRASDAELDALRAAFAVDDPRLFQDGHAGAGWGAAAPVAAWKVENTATWNKYAAERRAVRTDLQVLRDKGCRMPTVRIRKQVWDALRGLRDYDSALNEVPLLHATKRGVLLSVLVGGLNERYNASSRFGHGSYLADDIAKCDQYVDPDHAHPQGDATRRLADELGVAPEGDWKFVLVCRAILGHHASTTQRGTNFDGLWARNAALKELAHVHEGVPISHHSLVVRCPVHETPHVGARFRFSEYVLYHSARVMPDFLVAYRRQ